MDGCNKRNEQGCDARYLEDVIDGGKWPVILSGEHEVDEEDDGQGDNDASEEDLDWE